MIKYDSNSPLPKGVVPIAGGLFRKIPNGVDAKRTGVVSYVYSVLGEISPYIFKKIDFGYCRKRFSCGKPYTPAP